MAEAKTPDHGALVREEMTALEDGRGLVAAELGACEAELRRLRGDDSLRPDEYREGRRGQLALDAVLGSGDAAAELEALAAREKYLEDRAALCRDALAFADGRLEGLRRTYLGGHRARDMPLEEIPEVLREQVREARAEGGEA